MSETGESIKTAEQSKKPQIPEKYSSREALKDNPNIIEVVRNTYGLTSADREHSLIKTLHLNPCVSVFLYDQEQKIAGIAHIRENRSKKGVAKDLETFLNAMFAAGSQEKNNIIIHVIGGWREESLPTYAINNLLNLGFESEQIITNQRSEHEIPNLYTMQGRHIQSFSTPQNVAIDAKTGTIYEVKDRLPSQFAKTGSVFNVLKIGGATLTPDHRSLK